MNSTNTNSSTTQKIEYIIFQVNCIVYIPLFIAGIIIHICGVVYHIKNPDASRGSTVRIWAVAISIIEIVDLCYGGIYRTLTYARYVPYIPIIPYLLLQYFIGGLTPLYTLGFTIEKMIAVTWPFQCKDWIGARYVYFCIISTTVYLAIFCSLSTKFSFDWSTENMQPTAAYIYFYCFECIVNIIIVAVMHFVASLFIVLALIKASLNRTKVTETAQLKYLNKKESAGMYHKVEEDYAKPQEKDEARTLLQKEFRICVILLLMNIGYFVFVLPYWTMWIPRNMGFIKGRLIEVANYIVRPMPWTYRFFDALFLYVADAKFRSWIIKCFRSS